MDKVTQPSDAERRILKRVPAELKVEYKFDSTVSQGVTTNISESGIFLLSEKPALIGTKIYLRLQVKAGTPPLKIIGTVRRKVDAYEGDKPGMGIKFEVIYADDAAQMKNFINEYLGISVPDGGISAVAGTKSFKHVMSHQEPAPKPGAKPAAPAGAKPAGKVAPVKPAPRKRSQAEQDRRDLRKLEFSYDSWILQRGLKIGLVIGVPVVLYFVGKWFMKVLNSIQ